MEKDNQTQDNINQVLQRITFFHLIFQW